jgi:hypothetical protein
MKLMLTIILLIGIILVACTKEKTGSVSGPSTLIGKWNWVFSSGGFIGTTYTPKSTGESIKIEFDADSVYKEYMNDTLRIQCNFHLVKSKSMWSQDSTLLLKLDISSMMENFKILSRDSLILMDECYDCFESLYIRIK